LEILSGYDKYLFIGVPFGLKIVHKCLNPSKIDGSIQTKTIKVRRFFHCLLHLDYLLCQLPYLILKFKYGNIVYGETKHEKGLGKLKFAFLGLGDEFGMNMGVLG